MRHPVLLLACLVLNGCTISEAAYKRLHNRVVNLYLDPSLASRSDYRDAAQARLGGVLQAGSSSIVIERRLPSYSATFKIWDLKLWTPADAFVASYADGSRSLRSDIEQALGPAHAREQDAGYWMLPTGVLMVGEKFRDSAMFYPGSYAALGDLVEVPGLPALPTREAISEHFSSLKSSVRSLQKFSYSGDPDIYFWNRETREMGSVKRWRRGPDAISIGYTAKPELAREFGADFIGDLARQVGLASHEPVLRPVLEQAVVEDGLRTLVIDNIAYEIEGERITMSDMRSLSLIACRRAGVRQRQAEHGAPCSWRL